MRAQIVYVYYAIGPNAREVPFFCGVDATVFDAVKAFRAKGNPRKIIFGDVVDLSELAQDIAQKDNRLIV